MTLKRGALLLFAECPKYFEASLMHELLWCANDYCQDTWSHNFHWCSVEKCAENDQPGRLGASSHSENCNVEAATFSVFAFSTCKSEIGLDIIVSY